MKISQGKLDVLLTCYQLSWDSYYNDFDPRHRDREIYLIKITEYGQDVFIVYNQSLYDRLTYSDDIPVVDIVLSDGIILTIPTSTKDYSYKVFSSYDDALSCVLNTENIVCDIL